MRLRVQPGDQWEATVTFGGQEVKVGGNLPPGATAEQALTVVADGQVQLLTKLGAEMARQREQFENSDVVAGRDQDA